MDNVVTVILTCYNRKEKTLPCLKTLVEGNKNFKFNFIIVDDNSSDGTAAAVVQTGYDVYLIEGSGHLYWAGGMRKGIEYFLSKEPNDDSFCLLVNDDVSFYSGAIEELFNRLNDSNDTVIVGATCNSKGEFTYGLKSKERWYKRNITKRILPSNEKVLGDTMNANCVLIRNSILKDVGNFDSMYTHSLADYDYGFTLTKKGYKLISSSDYVGICESNSTCGTWQDKGLSLKERIKLKESPKGCPTNEWWYYLYKNYGFLHAITYTIISYIRILFNF